LIFPRDFRLLSTVTEVFELELAFYEYKLLTKSQLIRRGAYFESIGGEETIHYKICKNISPSLWKNRSKSTATYFQEGRFSTGYATHGLFPYRGKFHPQLVKALMNIIGIKEGDTVLDPMCGSGTLNVEAAIIGVNSIGIDKNPFACFMSRVKYEALSLDLGLLEELSDSRSLFKEFITKKGVLETLRSSNREHRVKRLFLLAFLDAMGYARRIKRDLRELFPIVLKRYIEQVKKFILISKELNLKFGKAVIEFGDARNLETIKDSTIDGVITSPPYSFAIDYAENDRPQLEYLGFNVNKLKQEMIGLRGLTRKERIANYFSDISQVLSEISRVLKNGRYAVIIIGSNDIQTRGVRLEKRIKEMAPIYNLYLIKEIPKPIKGIRNTMQEEFVLIFRKEV